jgi:hypothetical protein
MHFILGRCRGARCGAFAPGHRLGLGVTAARLSAGGNYWPRAACSRGRSALAMHRRGDPRRRLTMRFAERSDPTYPLRASWRRKDLMSSEVSAPTSDGISRRAQAKIIERLLERSRTLTVKIRAAIAMADVGAMDWSEQDSRLKLHPGHVGRKSRIFWESFWH